MKAGRLRYRVTLQEPTETRDAHGQPVKSWTDTAQAWAGYQGLRTEEKLQAHQIAATHWLKITLRLSSVTRRITDAWRVRFDSGEMTGNVYELHGPPDIHEPDAAVFLTARLIT